MIELVELQMQICFIGARVKHFLRSAKISLLMMLQNGKRSLFNN